MPTQSQVRQWRRNLAEERAEVAIYQKVAAKAEGEEKEILLALAEAERRHEQHWIDLLGDDLGKPVRPSFRTRLLGFLASLFGSVFSLALMQYSEERATTKGEAASSSMEADERVHVEVVRALATKGRERLSGTFRAAVFGANDGLVSNLALVVGVGASGVAGSTIILTGIAGLLAGALSMGAGEWVSVKSQRELLDASTPAADSDGIIPALDVEANELALVYRARGMSPEEASERAHKVLHRLDVEELERASHADYEEIGSPWHAAISSFLFFSTGAIIPVIPFFFLSGHLAVLVSAILVGLALLFTGGVVGILSGKPPFPRAIRQLLIGLGAAGVTYVLGLLFGTTLS